MLTLRKMLLFTICLKEINCCMYIFVFWTHFLALNFQTTNYFSARKSTSRRSDILIFSNLDWDVELAQHFFVSTVKTFPHLGPSKSQHILECGCSCVGITVRVVRLP